MFVAYARVAQCDARFSVYTISLWAHYPLLHARIPSNLADLKVLLVRLLAPAWCSMILRGGRHPARRPVLFPHRQFSNQLFLLKRCNALFDRVSESVRYVFAVTTRLVILWCKQEGMRARVLPPAVIGCASAILATSVLPISLLCERVLTSARP